MTLPTAKLLKKCANPALSIYLLTINCTIFKNSVVSKRDGASASLLGYSESYVWYEK